MQVRYICKPLLAINEARCRPPLPLREVEKIARSIHRRKACRPPVSEAVRAAVNYLRRAAEDRPVRGTGGGSGWSIYNAGLEALERFGKEHPEGVTLTLDTRTWGQMAGKDASTVSRFVRRSKILRRIERGSGRRPMTVLFCVPRAVMKTGVKLQHSSTRGDSQDHATPASVARRPLFRTLYRSRFSKRARKPRHGVVKGASRVRDHRAPPSEGRRRHGPCQAALLWKIIQRPDAKRSELAAMLGRKPDSLKKPLKNLVDLGLAECTGYGRYRATEDLEPRLEDVRELGEEPLDDRLQIQRHARQRTAYRYRHKTPQISEPSPESVENVRRSRDRREQHLREEEARKARRQEAARRFSEEYLAKRRRVEKLVEQGMSRQWAEAEVFDPGGSPFNVGARGSRR